MKAHDQNSLLRLGNLWYRTELQNRVSRFVTDQKALREELHVESLTPQGYSENLRERIRCHHEQSPDNSRILFTSGTRSCSKEIWYPSDRIKALRRECIRQTALLAEELDSENFSFYLLASTSGDRSLSSAIFRGEEDSFWERKAFEGSIFSREQFQCETITCEQHWIHLAGLLAVQPTLIVTVNPSSLLILIERCLEEWSDAARNLPQALSAITLPAAVREQALVRIAKVASARNGAPAPQELFNTLKGVFCWDGGYVAPYISSLASMLPDHVRFFPMFSLSTETVGSLRLPAAFGHGAGTIYPGVLYEFMKGEGDTPETLIPAEELCPGEIATLIVSDRYGLRRYDTEDVFECTGKIGDVPFIRFLRRRGLQFSFTGEKITAEQVTDASLRISARLEVEDLGLACFPWAKPPHSSIPTYGVVCTARADVSLAQLEQEFDRTLAELNSEYRAKRQSDRLAPPRIVSLSTSELVSKVLPRISPERRPTIGQFKLLPLYPDLDFEIFYR